MVVGSTVILIQFLALLSPLSSNLWLWVRQRIDARGAFVLEASLTPAPRFIPFSAHLWVMVVHLAAGGKERLPAAEGQPYHDPVCRVVRVPLNHGRMG